MRVDLGLGESLGWLPWGKEGVLILDLLDACILARRFYFYSIFFSQKSPVQRNLPLR